MLSMPTSEEEHFKYYDDILFDDTNDGAIKWAEGKRNKKSQFFRLLPCVKCIHHYVRQRKERRKMTIIADDDGARYKLCEV